MFQAGFVQAEVAGAADAGDVGGLGDGALHPGADPVPALPRIADMAQSEGLFVESLMAAIAQGDDAAKSRMRAFLEGKAGKVSKS